MTVSLSVVGDLENSVSFLNETDLLLLSSEKAKAKIVRKFSRAPVPFQLVFINHEAVVGFVEEGEIHPPKIRQIWKDHFPYDSHIEITPDRFSGFRHLYHADPKAVTILFTNNNADEWMPMTAWIAAHRIAHAMKVDHDMIARMDAQLFPLADRILRKAYKISFSKDWNTQTNHRFQIFRQIGTFKSARRNILRNRAEFYYELFAQYITTGDIRFDPLPHYRLYNLDWFDRLWHRPNFHLLPAFDVELEGVRLRIKDFFNDALISSVGKVYLI